jgi:hypothetical protein
MLSIVQEHLVIIRVFAKLKLLPVAVRPQA